MSDQRIAVLGAGPMGLAVAYQLTLDGHQPVVFEAGDRVGGMTASFDFDGLEIERYYHFHCVSDRHFLVLLEELGIAEKLSWVETKMGFYFNGKVVPWGSPFALLKFPDLNLLAKLRYGLHAFISTKRKDWRRLDRLEATGWIRRWVGDEAFEVLWRSLFEKKFYHFADKLSAAWIWSRIRRVGRSRENIVREKLGYLQGGSKTLLSALERHIESNGGEIRLNNAVSEVILDDTGVRGLESNGQFEAFDKVISTVPLPYVPRLIPDLPAEILRKYEAVDNIAVVNVIVKLKRALTDNFWLNINDPDLEIPGLVEMSNLRPLKDHIVYVPFYMPFEHPNFQQPDESFHEKVRRYLMVVNPNLREDDFLAIHASRYRYAQPICPPGFLDRLPPFELPVAGLWVADTSYYYPEDRGISESVGFGRMMAKRATR